VGLFPFMIMALIYRNVGRKKTAELMLLGEQISARTVVAAVAIGRARALVTRGQCPDRHQSRRHHHPPQLRANRIKELLSHN